MKIEPRFYVIADLARIHPIPGTLPRRNEPKRRQPRIRGTVNGLKAGSACTAWSVALMSLFCLVLSVSCSKDDDAEMIRRLIVQGANLAEKHDIGKIVELTTEDFVAMPGNHDRRRIKGIMWVAMQRYGKFSILYPQPEVRLLAEASTAEAELIFVIVKKEQSVPDLKKLYKRPRQWLQ